MDDEWYVPDQDAEEPQEAVERVRRNLRRARDGSLGPPVPPGSEPTVGDRILDGVNGR